MIKQGGFSMLEILAAMGLLGILSVIMMKQFDVMSTHKRTGDVNLDAQLFQNRLMKIMSNPYACQVTLDQYVEQVNETLSSGDKVLLEDFVFKQVRGQSTEDPFDAITLGQVYNDKVSLLSVSIQRENETELNLIVELERLGKSIGPKTIARTIPIVLALKNNNEWVCLGVNDASNFLVKLNNMCNSMCGEYSEHDGTCVSYCDDRYYCHHGQCIPLDTVISTNPTVDQNHHRSVANYNEISRFNAFKDSFIGAGCPEGMVVTGSTVENNRISYLCGNLPGADASDEVDEEPDKDFDPPPAPQKCAENQYMSGVVGFQTYIAYHASDPSSPYGTVGYQVQCADLPVGPSFNNFSGAEKSYSGQVSTADSTVACEGGDLPTGLLLHGNTITLFCRTIHSPRPSVVYCHGNNPKLENVNFFWHDEHLPCPGKGSGGKTSWIAHCSAQVPFLFSLTYLQSGLGLFLHTRQTYNYHEQPICMPDLGNK